MRTARSRSFSAAQRPDSSSPAEILYVGFLLGHGGDAVQMLALAAGMVSRGHRVNVVVPELETSIGFAERCRQLNVPVERSPLLRADARGVSQSIPNLLRFFRRNHAPLVHLHTGDVCLPRSVLLAMDLLRLRRAIVTIQSPYDTLRPGDARARFWARGVSRRLHCVVCPSEHSRRTQLGYGVAPDRVQTIHNSVDLQQFGCGDPTLARRALGLEPATPLVVFSSRIDPQKRPLDALEAFRRVATIHSDAHLVFLGCGALENETRAAAGRAGLANRVRFVGHQSNVPDWLAAATAWILPTESENFSLAVLEALAAGCPVVSTLCAGNDEVLVPEANALATPVGDVEAQAACLNRLLSDATLRNRLGAAGRATARRYSAEQMVDAYERCYTTLRQSVAV